MSMNQKVEKHIFYWKMIRTKKYLCVMYDNVNVVVDWETGKMVARYVGHFKKGCLMDNEYWIFSDEGLRRMPFPLIEDIPPRKPTFWGASLRKEKGD